MDVVRYASSRLPTPHGEFRLVVYRTGAAIGAGGTTVGGAIGDAAEEHVAMVMGDVAGAGVLARVHSSCFTGEVLGSLRCDCRAQLDLALARIAREGRGVVVYLVQEGRGIGLGNKIRAYALQDQGADTVEANLQLGFDADHRSYDLAAAILADLGATSVRLMTNNPDKIAGLVAAGMPTTHEPHWAEAAAQSQDYLTVKKEKMGHLA
ncbi:MAG: GTP cyclohydrolase II [Kofleriaceae bacterium]|jgi:GTP cyclohydrolase II|nr:GTP cyclohydrolase II [Kofleriaceae bacterium]MBP9169345.1 GTP cyclohydrolase II [Kofleriaceae bacterium]MBP9862254.1 GTP cyclohydrolase II [Kofleriaceae bacterium]